MRTDTLWRKLWPQAGEKLSPPKKIQVFVVWSPTGHTAHRPFPHLYGPLRTSNHCRAALCSIPDATPTPTPALAVTQKTPGAGGKRAIREREREWGRWDCCVAVADSLPSRSTGLVIPGRARHHSALGPAHDGGCSRIIDTVSGGLAGVGPPARDGVGGLPAPRDGSWSTSVRAGARGLRRYILRRQPARAATWSVVHLTLPQKRGKFTKS